MRCDIAWPFTNNRACVIVTPDWGEQDLRLTKTQKFGLHLRSHHTAYLGAVAEREEVTLSQAFAAMIERYGNIVSVDYKSPHKARQHLSIGADHLQMLEARAARAGVSRSEMSRRVIDAAMIDAMIEAET